GRPASDRAILDVGQKSISAYGTPAVLPDHPGCRIVSLSAEHATVDVGPGGAPAIGAKVRVTPGYSDFTFVLHDRVLGHRGGRAEVEKAARRARVRLLKVAGPAGSTSADDAPGIGGRAGHGAPRRGGRRGVRTSG